MSELVDSTTLHRTAKYFMDNGQAQSAEEAMAILGGFGLSIQISPAMAATENGQIALLTLVNLARRTFLGGVEVIDCPDVPLETRLSITNSLPDAVRDLGATTTSASVRAWPVATIGDVKPTDGAPAGWRLSWDGWRGGVMPLAGAQCPTEADAMQLSPAIAAAACAAEVFAFLAGDHPLAGRRTLGISLWRPGADWLQADPTEPALSALPSRLWLIGLGNLGQAYSWMLACLPYAEPKDLELVLQDFDLMAESNDSTSVLASLEAVGIRKTRWVAAWLEARGFSTAIEERLFGSWTQRHIGEPAVALCGVDNAEARASLEKAGFNLVVEAGLGAGTQSFRSFSMHSFPGSRSSEQIWSLPVRTAPDVTAMPAYAAFKAKGVDACGLVQLASRTIGVPFVGLVAAGVVIGELLRRLHGASGLEVVSGSVATLDDVECVRGSVGLYGHGHASARSS
ncbi:MAG: hypothetical protein Q7U20_07750 [Caulobacter sp.]|nr:hypothetical protein [Caulobacter sp.]